MTSHKLLDSPIHSLPDDLRQALQDRSSLTAIWNDITPLARTEWICLVDSAKRPETRQRRLKRTIDQLGNGQRRPCCWEGCPHRQKNTTLR